MTQSVREVPAPSVPRPRCAAACIPASNTLCVGPSLPCAQEPFTGPAEGSLLSVEPWPFQQGRWHGAGGPGGNQHSAGGHRARLQLLTGICDQYLLITSSGITSAAMQGLVQTSYCTWAQQTLEINGLGKPSAWHHGARSPPPPGATSSWQAHFCTCAAAR